MACANRKRTKVSGGELKVTGRHTARGGLARLWTVVLALLTVAFVGAALGAAAAEARPGAYGSAAPAVSALSLSPSAADPTDPVQVSLERAEDAEPSGNPNAVLVDAILRDSAGNVPSGTYRVFASVAPYLPEPGVDATPSKPEPCRQPHFSTNPEIDEGVFRCTYLVDFPDTWTFDVTVYDITGPKPVKVAKVQATFPINDAVVLQGLQAGLQYAVEGNPFDVIVLQVHFVSASVWLVAVMLMAFLAVPRLRRMLSVSALHTLELRRYSVNGAMWGMFGVVLVSGSFLLATQTAYDTPWSKSGWDNVTQLPYATLYFTTLYLKILIFLAMAAASVVLMMEAARQARISYGFYEFDTSDDAFWRHLRFRDAMRDTGERVAERRADIGAATATAVVTARPKPKILTQGVSPRTVWLCVFVVVGGLGAIGVCVTVLKYTHELIEMLDAVKAIAEAE